MSARWILPLLLLASTGLVRADGAADNLPDQVRPIPPNGSKLADTERSELSLGVDALGKEIDALGATLEGRQIPAAPLADVRVYHNAVRSALAHNEFFNVKELATARDLLKVGLERAKHLREGKAPWDVATGLVVRGYVSRIDGSVQPYGLVVPVSYQVHTPHRFRLDVWCHGRSETLSEVNFINSRQSSPGEFVAPNTFILHPYGRFCNANKFAGEIDVLEAIEDVKKHYPIDDNRLVMRGFSMGGASCWQFAVHYPSMWVAAAPGAGFAETPDFLKVFQNEVVQPSWYEKKLWHLYDCTDYAANLYNCPTVAYSGENDRQKQAAEIMGRALKDEGIELVHIKGAKAGHHYTPEAKAEINRRIDEIADAGRDPVPPRVCFTTWTLRYNRSFWVQIDGLEQHWERASVQGNLFGVDRGGPQLTTKNISGLTLTFPAGRCPFDQRTKTTVKIDEDAVDAPQALSDRSWRARFHKVHGKWELAAPDGDGKLHKRHGLQGPIDDAFMDSFLIVRPTGPALNEKVGKWVTAEMRHAVDHWRRQFRGEARVKDDQDVNEVDIAAHNLILWGDPRSNIILAKIAGKLPLDWDKDGVRLGDKNYEASHHVPVLIYPNPLNQQRYVVLNSGFTFREYDYLNNARQVPKLPDFAVVDVDVPVSSRAPGRIAFAGFFSEDWELPAAK